MKEEKQAQLENAILVCVRDYGFYTADPVCLQAVLIPEDIREFFAFRR